MFRCPRCDVVAEPTVRPARVVVEARVKTYPERRYRLRGDRKDRIDPGGVGTETVREVSLCAGCASAERGT